jgi:hypothetical protein
MYQQLKQLGLPTPITILSAIGRGLVPDWILQILIRFSCSLQIKGLDSPSLEELHQRKISFIKNLQLLPVALHQSMYRSFSAIGLLFILLSRDLGFGLWLGQTFAFFSS